jgi:hypothetical protein
MLDNFSKISEKQRKQELFTNNPTNIPDKRFAFSLLCTYLKQVSVFRVLIFHLNFWPKGLDAPSFTGAKTQTPREWIRHPDGAGVFGAR